MQRDMAVLSLLAASFIGVQAYSGNYPDGLIVTVGHSPL